MLPRERVQYAFAHQEADRVPVGDFEIMAPIASEVLGRKAITVGSGSVKKLQVEMIIAGRRDEFVERLQVDTLELYGQLDLDLVNVQLDPPKDNSFLFKEVTEKGWVMVNEETGSWSRYVFEKESDTTLEVDSSIKQEGFRGVRRHLDALESKGYAVDESCFETTKYIVEKAGEKRFIMAKLPDLIPTGLSWSTVFWEMMGLEPELTQRLCNVYLQKMIPVARKYIEIGIDCILICSDWAYNSGPIASPKMTRKYFVPQIQAIAELCHQHNVYVMKHTDGNIMKIADDFFNMGIDAYQGIEGNAGMSLAHVKSLYGDKITFMGNVDCGRILPFGSREEIVEETKRAIREGARGGGLILSSNNTIHSQIPAANYLTMLDAVHEFGKYPIEI